MKIGDQMLKKIIKLVLLIAWMAIIFNFSNDNGTESTKKSDLVITKIYQVITNAEPSKKQLQNIIDKYVYPIRKLAHFTEYAVLGILLVNFINEFKILSIKVIIISVILCMLYAISDEIHQLFSAGRSARILDVFIDTLGSSTGIIIYKLLNNKSMRSKKYE